jgi:uncharacterized protein (DUF433 family)
VSVWPASKAKRVLAALESIGWSVKRQTGSHRILCREEIGPRMLARLARRTGLRPEDIWADASAATRLSLRRSPGLYPPVDGMPSSSITCTPGVRSGKACLAGTRITVSDVLEYMASGMSQDDLLADFPDLRPEHIQAVLRYATER